MNFNHLNSLDIISDIYIHNLFIGFDYRMDTQRLRYFVEVARQNHFSRAAAACRVSQPSLSQQIRKLEQEVGGALLERKRGHVGLTPFGMEFMKHAQAILAGVESAEEFVRRAEDGRQRTLRFGAIPTIAPYLIPDLFAAIRRRLPSARFELTEAFTEILADALMTGRIDFALWSPPTAQDAACDNELLLRDELLLTLPKTHPLAKAPSLTPAMLAGERMLLLENTHCLASQAEGYCEDLGLHPDIAIRGTQIDTLLGLVEHGFGLTFTPAIAAKAHRHRKVTFRTMTRRPCHRDIRLAWLKRPFLTRRQQDVVLAAKGLKA